MNPRDIAGNVEEGEEEEEEEESMFGFMIGKYITVRYPAYTAIYPGSVNSDYIIFCIAF